VVVTILRNLWDRVTTTHTSDGCCTCGGPHADFLYFGAMEGSDLRRPDWAQCTGCHEGSDEHAAWLRSLRFERATA
jgi:hypothetical protein